jgi:hypothetical protein
MENSLTPQSSENAEVLSRVKDLVNRCYQAKLAVDRAEELYSKLKTELTELMSTAEIDKFIGDEATASCKLKTNVTVPKDIVGKRSVFKYIRDTYGEEVLEEMLTINPASFASWYNQELEAKVASGDLDFKIEGVKPYEYFTVGFTKRRS